jgi:hypothetical protein
MIFTRLTGLALSAMILAILVPAVLAQGGRNPGCVADCDQRLQDCRNLALGVYITCGQQGGTEQACKKRRDDAYSECYRTHGCKICSGRGADWRLGLGNFYYCDCGDPYDEVDTGCETDAILDFDGGFVGPTTAPCDCDPADPTCLIFDPDSPVIYDVRGDGIHLTSAANGISIDIRANGHPLPTAWTELNSDDAWLVLDRNGNGTIDSGAELFGDHTPQTALIDRNGFAALRDFDVNHDGEITAADPVYARLRFWQDKNHNGVSEPGELHPLSEFGVASIPVNPKESRRKDRYGNIFRYRARVNNTHSEWDLFDVFLVHH